MTIEPADKLAARLKELRPSATVAVSERSAANPRDALDEFVVSLGFRAIGNGWRELGKDEAIALLRRVLELNLAYDVSEMESEEAAAVVQEYLEMAEAAEYYTNGAFNGTGWGGHKVAPGTFDTGVAWVGTKRIGILWVEDED